MRTFSIISTIVVLMTSVLLAQPVQAQWPQTTQHNQWNVEFGAKGLDRPGTELALPLISDSVTLAPLFTTDDATDLGAMVGGEIKFNHQRWDGSEWEVRSYLGRWEEAADTIQGPDLVSPFFSDGIVPDNFNYSYESDIFSIELMKRRAISPGIVAMFGPRVVSTSDLVSLHSDLLVDPGDGSPPVLVESQSFIEATNVLLGFQGGFEFNRPVTNAIYMNGYIRAGGYYNPTEVTNTDFSTIDPVPVVNVRTKSTGSFLGEVGGRIYMDLVPNCASCYIGYEATWIDGIALAPPQVLLGPTTPVVETSNTPFFHGINFGLRYTYGSRPGRQWLP